MSSRALPDLCRPLTDRDSAALRSAGRDILGNDTTQHLLPPGVCARPSIKSSYRALIHSRPVDGHEVRPPARFPLGHVLRQEPASRLVRLKVSHQLPARFRLEFRRLVSREDQGRHAPALSARCACVRCCGFTRGTQPGLGSLENSGFENVPHRLDKLEQPEGQTSSLHGMSWQTCITASDWAEPSRPG